MNIPRRPARFTTARNREARPWTLRAVAAVAGLFLLLPLSNLLIDPFGVLGTSPLPREFQVNGRFLKIEHLRQHPEIDTLLMGSSRMGYTDPGLVQFYLPGSHVYNMAMSGATLYDHLINLRWLLESGQKVRTVIMQIDLTHLRFFRRNDDTHLWKLHPSVAGVSKASFYWDYLTILPLMNMRRKVALNLSGKPFTWVDIDGTGCFHRDQDDQLIAQDPDGYVAHEQSLHINHFNRTIRATHLEDHMRAMRGIVSLCRDHDVRLIVLICPHNYNQMNMLDTADMLEYLRRLAWVVPYWDFSGYNSVTLDNRLYYEYAHYRPPVGAMVMARLFGDEEAGVPTDFGRYVTRDIVEEHLRLRLAEVERFEADHPEMHREASGETNIQLN